MPLTARDVTADPKTCDHEHVFCTDCNKKFEANFPPESWLTWATREFVSNVVAAVLVGGVSGILLMWLWIFGRYTWRVLVNG